MSLSKIKILPENVINKIAAGEVIQRPLSVVKELIENSIDALSTSIELEIKEGGKKLIKVKDNGIGMTLQDLKLSISRFATSKINEFEDIYKIKSYGFRGEALASILAVSELTINTKSKEEQTAYQLYAKDGKIIYIKPIAKEIGTTILVENLFENVPVRKKFLKTTKTEYNKILDFISKIAIVNDNIEFIFKSNKKLIFKIAKDKDIFSRIKYIYKNIDTDKLIYGQANTPFANIKLFISKLDYLKTSRNYQIYFINKRVVKDGLINSAIDEIYSEFTDLKKFHPVVFLFIEIRPDLIDINIHPQKTQIKFLHPYEFKYSLKNVIRDILKKEYSYKMQNFSNNYLKEDNFFYDNLTNNNLLNDNFTNDNLSYLKDSQQNIDFKDFYFQDNKLLNENEFKFLDVIDNLYFLILENKTLYIVDQHNAHERIIYDKLLNTQISVQNIIPLKINLNNNLFTFLKDNIENFINLGFNIDIFSDNSIILRSIPGQLKDTPISENWFENILQELFFFKDIRKFKPDFLKTIACKSAIKRGEKLTIDEYKNLWINLKKTTNMYICPHGRPITIKFDINELHKLFKRKKETN